MNYYFPKVIIVMILLADDITMTLGQVLLLTDYREVRYPTLI